LGTLLLAVIAFLTFTSPALAYIDPVTGSVVVQAVIGAAAAALVAVKGVRSRILSLFQKPDPEKDRTDNGSPRS